jgi:hypothetical protein
LKHPVSEMAKFSSSIITIMLAHNNINNYNFSKIIKIVKALSSGNINTPHSYALSTLLLLAENGKIEEKITSNESV